MMSPGVTEMASLYQKFIRVSNYVASALCSYMHGLMKAKFGYGEKHVHGHYVFGPCVFLPGLPVFCEDPERGSSDGNSPPLVWEE